jgi:ribosomal protein S19
MSNQEGQILIGMKAISSAVGGTSENTIRRWVDEYPSIPIKMISGQWTTTRHEIVEWWHAFVGDRLGEYVATRKESVKLKEEQKEPQKAQKASKKRK